MLPAGPPEARILKPGNAAAPAIGLFFHAGGGANEKTLAPRFFQRHQRVAKGGADPACTGNAQPSTSFQMVVAQARV